MKRDCGEQKSGYYETATLKDLVVFIRLFFVWRLLAESYESCFVG